MRSALVQLPSQVASMALQRKAPTGEARHFPEAGFVRRHPVLEVRYSVLKLPPEPHHDPRLLETQLDLVGSHSVLTQNSALRIPVPS